MLGMEQELMITTGVKMSAHILYLGHVQGVGFRYMVRQHAQHLGLTGWVRNLPDDGVEIVVDGDENEINDLCRKIEAHFSGHIRSKQISFDHAPSGALDFKITF